MKLKKSIDHDIPTSIERVQFRFKGLKTGGLTEEQKVLFKKVIISIQDSKFEVLDDNSWDFSFNIDFLYYGMTQKTLEHILMFLDMDLVPEIETEELTKGKCLIQDVLLKIEQIERKLEGER